MNRDELVSQIRFLLKLQEDKDAIIDRQQESLDEMKADLKEARKDNKALQKQLAESSKKLDAALASIEELRRQLTDMMNRNETSIRSMTVERKRSSYAGLLPTGRKNSLMFGSHKGAEMSAIFHTFIETCKINGISTIEYFKKLLSELLTGNNKTRTLFAHSVGFEYASLLPQTIGIKR